MSSHPRVLLFSSLIVSLLCTGMRCDPKVKRKDPDTVVDYSGRWNDTDSQRVAAAVIEDCMASAWIDEYKGENNKRPVMVVGRVKNKSHEHIDTELFTKEFEKALIKSGRVRVVAEKDMREDVRAERKDIQMNADPATIKKFGKEIGADFVLLGVVGTIKDEVKSRYVMYYQVDLELINIESNEKVWIGEKKIKKDIKKNSFKLF
ncbi:MAG: penicillin-binding protein activator LpoB [Planctomycetota bacterium]|nr:penicillin-binding protein activator LpoB [Planctomycetota bacterium]MDA1142588.1 penicillin-binding protein activator LpoB [Planctomycetota bacterium]